MFLRGLRLDEVDIISYDTQFHHFFPTTLFTQRGFACFWSITKSLDGIYGTENC